MSNSNFNDKNRLQKKMSNRAFAHAVSEHGDSHRAVMYGNMASQADRFNQILKHLFPLEEEASLADIGCGNCGLYESIRTQHFPIKYTGIDINEELLGLARSRYQGLELINADITHPSMSMQFDYVVMSGLFNLDAGQDPEWCQSFIASMYKMCRKATVFNAVSTHVNFTEEGMYYLNPAETLSYILQNLTSRVVLEHGVPQFNYTIVMYKEMK